MTVTTSAPAADPPTVLTSRATATPRPLRRLVAAAQAAEVAADGAGVVRRRANVLLACAAPETRVVITTVLEMSDRVRVVGEAGDVDEAKLLVATEEPNVVLIDLSFAPRRDLLRWCADLSTMTKPPRVVLIAAEADLASQEIASRLGGVPLIPSDRLLYDLLPVVLPITRDERRATRRQAAASAMRSRAGRLRVLVIEDDRRGQGRLSRTLANDTSLDAGFDGRAVGSLTDALDLLITEPVEVILAELDLPDASGLHTVRSLRAANPDIPIVAVTDTDEIDGAQVLRAGAQDYVARADLGAALLIKSVRFANERAALLRVLKEQATVDPMTRVLNRRGFMDESTALWRTSVREELPMTVITVEIDGLQSINDNHGHDAGDHAVTVVARALADSSRATDVVGRLGGATFAVTLLGAVPREVIARRLRQSTAELTRTLEYPIRTVLGASTAVAPVTLQSVMQTSRDDLLAQRA